MKRSLLVLFLTAFPLVTFCADEDQTQLLGVLQSDAPPRKKEMACEKLKWIATPAAVPVVAPLLTNSNGILSHAARYVLESLPGREAEQALLQALPQTSGSNQAGIINSLGVRQDKEGVPDVARWLWNADTNVAAAAAHALGEIGGPTAQQDLEGAWKTSDPGPVREAEADGLLACANQLLTAGDKPGAEAVFQKLYDGEKREDIRVAAFRGVILSVGKPGIIMMVNALKGPDGPEQAAALALAGTVGSHATTAGISALLPKLPVAEQIAVLHALQQRSDRAAEQDVLEILDSKDRDVRLAAISALGDLADGHAALRLAREAAESKGEERAAAREALVNLRQGPVTEPILKVLPDAPPNVAVELIRALGDRGDVKAAPRLLELAGGPDEDIRGQSLQALAQIAGPAEIPGMLRLVINSTNDDFRSALADALTLACQRMQAHGKSIDGNRLAQAVLSAPPEVRVALLAVCSSVNDAKVREAIRSSTRDPNALVRAAAIRALCASQDEELLPDILQTAISAPEENFRLLAIRGCVRMVTQDQTPPLPAAKKLDILSALLKTPLNAAGKREVLSGLGSISDAQALELVKPLLKDNEVKVEAAAAVKEIAKNTKDKALRESAEAALGTPKVAQ